MTNLRHLKEIMPDALVINHFTIKSSKISPYNPAGYDNPTVRIGDVNWPEGAVVIIKPDKKPNAQSVLSMSVMLEGLIAEVGGAEHLAKPNCVVLEKWEGESRQVQGTVCLELPELHNPAEEVFNSDSWPEPSFRAVGIAQKLSICWDVTLTVTVDVFRRTFCCGGSETFFWFETIKYQTDTPNRASDGESWTPCSFGNCGGI